MPNKPDKKEFHLDSTNLGSQLTTNWVEEPNAFDEATVRQQEAAAKCMEALVELYEAILAWTLYLCCCIGSTVYPMTSNRCDSLVEKIGTQTIKALACLEDLEKANQELDRAITETEFDSLEHLKHYWADKESEPSVEPPKGVALEKNPLLVPPELSAAIGLHEAIILQQMHYWLSREAGKLINGIRWIWNTLDGWLKQFPFLSKWELRKALYRLRNELGLVEFEQRRKHEWNRTGWYTINYRGLKALLLSTCEHSHIDVWESTHRCVTVHTSYKETEISSEISSETTAPAAVILNFEEEEGVLPNLLASLVDQEEEEGVLPNLLASLVDQEEKELTGVASTTLVRDEFSAQASASVEKMDLVDDAGISLNPQLKRTLVNYTLEQVKAAVEHYRSVSREKKPNNPAGWLTECLKGQWWVVGTITATQEVSHPASRVYTAADFEVKKSATVPQSFKDMLAGLARKHNFAT